jgi:hypothetical protein
LESSDNAQVRKAEPGSRRASASENENGNAHLCEHGLIKELHGEVILRRERALLDELLKRLRLEEFGQEAVRRLRVLLQEPGEKTAETARCVGLRVMAIIRRKKIQHHSSSQPDLDVITAADHV